MLHLQSQLLEPPFAFHFESVHLDGRMLKLIAGVFKLTLQVLDLLGVLCFELGDLLLVLLGDVSDGASDGLLPSVIAVLVRHHYRFVELPMLVVLLLELSDFAS